MPLTVPTLDDRSYEQLLDEALARIPVHNPEWTNFNDSDPGVTLVQLFSFLTESLLYRANQIPERNRQKFLQLLGIPLRPPASAKGLVTFTNERGSLATLTLERNLEVRAGQVPFRTTAGLDVLPVETRVYYKRTLPLPDQTLSAYYRQLYASYTVGGPAAVDLLLYESVPLPEPRAGVAIGGVDLGADTVDGSLWVALLLRASDVPRDAAGLARQVRQARSAIGGKTVSLGVVPALADAGRVVRPGAANRAGEALLQVQVPIGGHLGATREPRYRSLDARSTVDVLAEPGVLQVTLPTPEDLELWDDMEPLESGVGDFPPALDDSTLEPRVLTWLRVRLPSAKVAGSNAGTAHARIAWVGINVAGIEQRAHLANERLPDGTGEPDQERFLAKGPIVPGSVRLTVTNPADGVAAAWSETDDLLSAGAEVQVRDNGLLPVGASPPKRPTDVFTVDPEAGAIRFGDGLHGRRPPFGALIRADYDVGMGRDGNVGIGAVATGALLPPGVKVANPIPTWGGDAGEGVAEGEKQVARSLQHRDRLVTAEDFATIARRAPGVDIGRIDVLPAFSPELGQNDPGDAAGAVTLMVVPAYDAVHPECPEPDQLFLDAVCAYVAPRRLVTTELYLRGPVYKPIWVTVGIDVVAGESVGEVRERVRREIRAFLSPLPNAIDPSRGGWPLRKPVASLELWAIANRVPGVALVNGVNLALGDGAPMPQQVEMAGLELPCLAGVDIGIGDPPPIDAIRGQTLPQDPVKKRVPVPVIPQECA